MCLYSPASRCAVIIHLETPSPAHLTAVRPVATDFGVVALYRIAEHIATRIRLRNWNLVEHAARIHERNRDVSWAVCWVSA